MRKRLFALVLCIAIGSFCSLSASAEENAGFSDVEGSASYSDAIQWAAEQGYINGYPDGRFGVNDPVTRAQLAAIFYRAAGSPAVSGTSRFPDVRATAYYVDAAIWAEDSGLISGYPDGNFGVDDPVTRQQVVTILWRWAGSPDASGEYHVDDSAVADFAQIAVDWSQSRGILASREDGRFAPNDNATRAEVAAVLQKFLLETDPLEGEDAVLNITVNGTTLTATLEDNSSAQALRNILANGPLTVQMSDYANMEKVGSLGQNLPRNDERITTEAGDVILYQGNQITIYYSQNTWNLTRLGRVNGVSAQELRSILGSDDVSVTFALG